MTGVNTDLANTSAVANTANTGGANTRSTPPDQSYYTPTEDKIADGNYTAKYETDANEGSAVALANANDYGDPDYQSFNELDAGIGSKQWSHYGNGNENDAESQWSSPFNATGNKFEYSSFHDQTTSYVYNSETGGGDEIDPDKVGAVKQDVLTNVTANQSEIDSATAQLERHGEELENRLDTLNGLRADAEARGDTAGVEALDKEIARTESAIADHDAKMTEYNQALSDYNVSVENLENAEGYEEVQVATDDLIAAEGKLSTSYEATWNVANSYNADLHRSSDWSSPSLAQSIGDSLRNGIANEAKDAVNLAGTATENVDALIGMEENYIAELEAEQQTLLQSGDYDAGTYQELGEEIEAAKGRINDLQTINEEIDVAYQTQTPEELTATVQQAEVKVNQIYEHREVPAVVEEMVGNAANPGENNIGAFKIGVAGEWNGHNSRETMHEGGSTVTVEFSVDNSNRTYGGKQIDNAFVKYNDRGGFIEVAGQEVGEIRDDDGKLEYRTYDANGNASEWTTFESGETITFEAHINEGTGHDVDSSGNFNVNFQGITFGKGASKTPGLQINDYTVTTTALNPELAEQGAQEAFVYGPPEGSYISITGDHKSIDIGDDLRAEVPSVAEGQGIYEQEITGTFQQLIQVGWKPSAILDVINDDTKGYQYFFDSNDNLKEPPVEVTPEAEVAQTMN